MITKAYKGSISQKLTLAIFFITSITVLIGYTIAISLYIKAQKEDDIHLNSTIQSVIAQDLAKLIFLNNVTAAADITAKLKAFKGLNAVTVYNSKHKAIYEYSKNQEYKPFINSCNDNTLRTYKDSIELTSSIFYAGNKIGCSRINLHFDSIFSIIKKHLESMLVFYFFMLLLSLILAKYYAKRFTKPILYLADFLDSIEFTSSLNRRINIKYDDEFGKLYEETNMMLENIESSLISQKKAEEELKFLQQYDALTGFANKELFLKSLQIQIDKKKENIWHFMFCLNIKKFNQINELYGHTIGDILLQKLAQRIKQDFSNATIFAKIGVDEFIVCYRDVSKNRENAVGKAEKSIEILQTEVYNEFRINEKLINISLYIGINVYQDERNSSEDILRATDAALHMAKNEDKNLAFYNKEIENETLKRLEIATDLHQALKEHQFELYYQLQYKDDGSIYGAEALIRWNHPQKGLIPPVEFIEIAENSGVIVAVGDWIIKQGCKQLANWGKDDRTKEWVLAINVSSKQFDDYLVSKIKNAIVKNGINSTKLKVELTESLFLENFDENVQKLQELKDYGIQISIDDFGTGYSSLQYLKKLPTNQIKIDQSFVVGMLNDTKDIAIIKSIIELGDALELDVIAEGVETKEHFELLKSLHCRYFQGYYFAKPQPIEKIKLDNSLKMQLNL